LAYSIEDIMPTYLVKLKNHFQVHPFCIKYDKEEHVSPCCTTEEIRAGMQLSGRALS
jgi:hypothetical protein